MAMVRIMPARSGEEVERARELFLEYANGLGVDLCFQSFDKELAGLPGDYAQPKGRLFLAYAPITEEPSGGAGPQLAGCGALRRIDDATCEMKRLYVRPGFRGQGVGRALAVALIDAAREIGYSRMVLDTLPSMVEAHKLYRILGFREIPPYRHNPVPGALFLELLLS
jgi:putative acetyltransferase